ncbi:MAG: topoisomerase [Chloroflexota bacterium]|nr:topoisomerase [Chloroflexota bacterium]
MAAASQVAVARSPADSIQAAKAAGLRYADGSRPGITRRRVGKGFAYRAPDGSPVADPAERRRIGRLAIPPAWTDVRISPHPNDHLQATGRDARGRKQYRYHERWREVRDGTKYARMIEFGKALPTIRARTDADLRRPGLTRERVLAAVVRLLESTLIRVGNDEYAKHNRSFGLTTMRDDHVEVAGSRITFRFRGKSGVPHEVDVSDRRIARILVRLDELPGQHLFRYLADDGEPRQIDSDDVNAYLGEITGEDFTAKDFRTWAGTVLAARALSAIEPYENEAQAKRNLLAAIEDVAKKLGNTRAICRKCYIHPAIIEGYLDGSLLRTVRRRAAEVADANDLDPDEQWVLDVLRSKLETEPKVA